MQQQQNNSSIVVNKQSLTAAKKISYSDNFQKSISDQPKLIVNVSSNNTVPTNIQQHLSPLVQSELNQLCKQDNKDGHSFGAPKLHDPGTAYIDPNAVQMEVSVKTDYNVESSPPTASIDEKGLTYTINKTLVTTTKQVTTHLTQAYKTEVEIVHVDSKEDLPERLLLANTEPDKVFISVTSVSNMSKESGFDADSTMKLQKANENICKAVESSIFNDEG